MIRLFCIFIGFLFGCLGAILPTAFADTAQSKNVSQTMNEFMQKYQVPGAAVVILNHGKSQIYVFGVANQNTKKPVTADTVFAIGSITKLFTAFLVAEQMSQGHMKMDDKITSYLPSFEANKNFNQMTLLDLVTHAAGFPLTPPDNVQTQDQIKSYLLKWQPAYPIGTQWQYSNIGIELAGEAVQAQNKSSLQRLYEQDIFSPLHMTKTTIIFTPRLEKAMAQGYDKQGLPMSPTLHSRTPAASAGRSTIRDLSYFLAAAAELPKTPQDIQSAMKMAQTPRARVDGVGQAFVWQTIALNDKQFLDAPEEMDLGPTPLTWLPVSSQMYNPTLLIDKTGSADGFRAYIAVIPAQESGIVILTNRYVSNGAIVNTARKILLDTLQA